MVMDKQVTQVSLFACMGPLNDIILAHPQQKETTALVQCETSCKFNLLLWLSYLTYSL